LLFLFYVFFRRLRAGAGARGEGGFWAGRGGCRGTGESICVCVCVSVCVCFSVCVRDESVCSVSSGRTGWNWSTCFSTCVEK
jgi:hypothetical protein